MVPDGAETIKVTAGCWLLRLWTRDPFEVMKIISILMGKELQRTWHQDKTQYVCILFPLNLCPLTLSSLVPYLESEFEPWWDLLSMALWSYFLMCRVNLFQTFNYAEMSRLSVMYRHRDRRRHWRFALQTDSFLIPRPCFPTISCFVVFLASRGLHDTCFYLHCVTPHSYI
jgi:hypothetical protein